MRMCMCICIRRAPYGCHCVRRTSNQLEAELIDLAESLAAATGRTLTWTRSARDPPAATASSVDATDITDAGADGALVSSVVAGEIAPHALEKTLSTDLERAVRVRRGWLEQTAGVSAAGLPHASAFDAPAFYGSSPSIIRRETATTCRA